MGVARVAVLCAVLAVCWTGQAVAQEGGFLQNLEQAKELYQRAEAHYGRGEFQEALPLYEQAYQKAPEPMFLLGIGQCHKAMDNCKRALVFFERYLVTWPDAPNRGAVERLVQSCRDRLEHKRREQQEQLERARAREREAEERERRAREEELRQQAAASEEAAPRRGLSPAWFWSSVALSGALLATGAVTGGIALSKNQKYKDSETPVSERLELRDAGEDLQLVSTVTLIAGGVAAGAAALLYFYTGWDREQETQVSAGAWSSGAGVFVSGSF